MNKSAPYRGRFAPSPTGELHFGSLIAAVASYLQARANNGEWLVRIEDIDETRTVPQSDQHILQALDSFGFEWDGEVIYQSHRKKLYQDYLDQLITKDLIFACDCTRSQLRQKTEQPGNPNVYPGICRQKSLSTRQPHALRCRTEQKDISFHDQIQGEYVVNLEKDCGDFIVKRRDGFFAYQLVVVIDDAEQGMTDIVRGADLLSATPQQIYLQQLFSMPATCYAHLPIAMHDNGNKLSKSHQDLAVRHQSPAEILCSALAFLNQQPPADLLKCSLEEIWGWASQHWDMSKVEAKHEIIVK